tara:strand:+ start:727 stop:1329 length:603 start_codon:yes stop_codon:yes gene_type:complete
MKSFLIGIAGGSGAGKTFIANKILNKYKKETLIIEQDSYYKDLSDLELEKRKIKNFDHPNAIDSKLLHKHIKKLISGQSINKPIYNFSNHTRRKKTITLKPHPIIILEGILIFTFKQILDLFSLKIFIDIQSDIRFIRRLTRDLEQRNRNSADICKQYLNSVRPMHTKFVEPSKKFSDIIIKSENDYNTIFNIIKKNIYF